MLYDYRAREYDPWHGRFCQRDPAEYAESVSLYQYALSNPATWSDPSGQFSLIEIGGVSSFDVDWNMSQLDVGVSLLGAIRGFVGLINTKNALLAELTGSPMSAVDTQGLDAALEVWEAFENARTALMVGGVVKAGAGFAQHGAMALFRQYRLEGHHRIPMFMGGLPDQIKYVVPAWRQREFHNLLNRRLAQAGLPRDNQHFMQFLIDNPGRQAEAFDIVRTVAREFDDAYNTCFETAFNVNFLMQAFRILGSE